MTDPMTEEHWRICPCGKSAGECPKDGKPACARPAAEVQQEARDKQAAYEYMRDAARRRREEAKGEE